MAIIRHFAATVEKSGDSKTLTAKLTTQSRISNHLYDADGNAVDEVLLTRGARFPRSRKVPMYYCHEYRNIGNALGSMVNLRKSGRFLLADLDFSATATNARTLVDEEHLDSTSVGMDAEEEDCRYIKAGDSKTYFQGEEDEYTAEGPCVVYEVWQAREGSLTSLPADTNAKISFTYDADGLVKFKKPKKAQKTQVANIDTPVSFDTGASVKQEETKIETTKVEAIKVEAAAAPTIDVKAETTKAVNEYKKFCADVRNECKRFEQLPANTADELCEKFTKFEDVRTEILDRLASKQKESSPSVIVTGSGADRAAEQLSAALTHRFLSEFPTVSKRFDEKTGQPLDDNVFNKSCANHYWKEDLEQLLPKNVDSRFRRWEFLDYCRYSLELKGIRNLYGMTRAGLVEKAMTSGNLRVFNAGEQGYNGSGDLAPILQDALHRTLIAGYTSARTTWQTWCKVESSPDLHDHHLLRLSGTGYADQSIEGQMPQQKQLYSTDSIVKKHVHKDHVSLTWEVLANDSLGAVARMPASMGATFSRTVNSDAITELVGNSPTDEDGYNFYDNSHHGNDVTTTGVNSAGLGTMMTALSTQKDLDGVSVIDLGARYVLGSFKLARTIQEQLLSQYDPTQNNPSFVYNPYQTLLPVIDALVDTNNTAQGVDYFYMLPEMVDAPVAVVFYSGEEAPVITSFVDLHTDSFIVKGRQTWGTRAYDFRRSVRGH